MTTPMTHDDLQTTSFPHLRAAPIREATIDCRLPVGVSLDFSAIKEIASGFAADYPQSSERHLFEAKVEFGNSAGNHGQVSSRPEAIMLHAKNGLDLLQIRTDGISVHRLAPYTNWGEIKGRFLDALSRFAENSGIETASRFSVRYINEIGFPRSELLADYLNIGIQIPSELPSDYGDFLLRWKMLFRDKGAFANIHVMVPAGQEGDRLVAILDIDAMHVLAKPRPYAGCDELLETLREIKNKIFFSCISKKAKGEYS